MTDPERPGEAGVPDAPGAETAPQARPIPEEAPIPEIQATPDPEPIPEILASPPIDDTTASTDVPPVPVPDDVPAPAPVTTTTVAPPPAIPAPPPAMAPVTPAVPAASVVAEPPRRARRGRSGIATFTRILAFLFGVLQALLILRIILLLLVADQDNSIVAAILTITDPFVEPFRGMFALDEVTGAQGSVLDIAAIVALVAWTLIETLTVSLLRLFDRRG